MNPTVSIKSKVKHSRDAFPLSGTSRRGILALAFGAGVLLALSACSHGRSSGAVTPSPASTTPTSPNQQLIASQLNPTEVARFEQTLNSVSLAIHWRSPKDAPQPPPTSGVPKLSAQEAARVSLSNAVESSCQFDVINDDKGPTETSMKPKLTNSTATNMNVGLIVSGASCPIHLRWKNSNFIASINTTDPKLKARTVKTEFTIHLKPVAKKIQPALDVHDYRLHIHASSAYSADSGNLATGTGTGFIDTVSQGRIQISMLISSTTSGQSLDETSVYKFVYPDGTWYELGQTLTQTADSTTPQATYFLGNNSIDAPTFKRYLFQLGLDQFNLQGLLP